VLTTDDSKVYVCNRFGHRAHIFDKSGQVINLWEGVRRPEDAASQSDGNIAVCKPSSAYCYLDELDFSAPFWVKIFKSHRQGAFETRDGPWPWDRYRFARRMFANHRTLNNCVRLHDRFGQCLPLIVTPG
jgi:hypothetical protein